MQCFQKWIPVTGSFVVYIFKCFLLICRWKSWGYRYFFALIIREGHLVVEVMLAAQSTAIQTFKGNVAFITGIDSFALKATFYSFKVVLTHRWLCWELLVIFLGTFDISDTSAFLLLSHSMQEMLQPPCSPRKGELKMKVAVAFSSPVFFCVTKN